jgi:hypothetical protein
VETDLFVGVGYEVGESDAEGVYLGIISGD